jgi:translation initiation factor IF-3
MNYEKFIYKQKRDNKQQKSLPLKEIKFGPNISEHDIDTKVRHIIKFLDKGHKVKTYVQFRGREMAHQDLGMKVLMIVATKVEDYGVPEAIPNKVVGRRLIMQLKPKQR